MTTDVAGPIKTRLTEITAARKKLDREEKALNDALQALRGSNGSASRRSGRVAAAARRSTKRAPRGQRRHQVLDVIEKSGPVKPSVIAKEIGTSPNQVSTILRALKGDKLVKKTKDGYSLTSTAKAAAGGS